MNTHSKEGDCRMELLSAAAIKAGCRLETVRAILEAATTEEGVRLIEQEGKRDEAMAYVMERIMFFLEKRAQGKTQENAKKNSKAKMEIGCIMYSNDFGLLAQSENAEAILKELQKSS